jgi:hypothetical protein
MKKTILALLLLWVITSYAQPFTGLSYNAYNVVLSNYNDDPSQNCDVEICISQIVECPDCIGGGPSSIMQTGNCFTLHTYFEQSPVSFYEPVSVVQPCPCTVLSYSATIRRISTNELINIPPADIGTFMDILRGVSTATLTYTFQKDCNNFYNPHNFTWHYAGGKARLEMF